MAKMNITEKELNKIITESINKVLSESTETNTNTEEGWVGDKWNQVKSAAKTFTNGATNGSFGDRFNAAKKNWNTQGEINDLVSLRQQLSQLVRDKKISPSISVAQLIGGEFRKNAISGKNARFGKMDAMIANRRGQVNRRGGTSYEEE